MARQYINYGGQQINVTSTGETYVNGRLVTSAAITGISFDASTGQGTVTFSDGTSISNPDDDSDD